ncbi:hypothetical protein BJ170DRAFT_439402 [Xylariales sp. AK1849]|nr:hypothetical protein BJ170DRAFT_439402 [Xylariales sp. AK1849]
MAISASRQQPGPLIWMNGFPGVGKLTIARELLKLLGEQNAILIDNHELIDLVAIPRDHPEYHDQRRVVHQAALTEWIFDLEAIAKTIIFTDFQAADEMGLAIAREYQDAAAKSNRLFLPVYVASDLEENMRRVITQERRDGAKAKLVDAVTLERLLSRYTLFVFEDGECIDGCYEYGCGKRGAGVAGEDRKFSQESMISHKKKTTQNPDPKKK